MLAGAERVDLEVWACAMILTQLLPSDSDLVPTSTVRIGNLKSAFSQLFDFELLFPTKIAPENPTTVFINKESLSNSTILKRKNLISIELVT